MILRNSLVSFLCSLVFFSAALAQTPRKSRGWESPKELIGSPTYGVLKGAKTLGIQKGDYILVSFSTQCGDCDRAARTLNQRTDLDHIVGITTDPDSAVSAWKEKLGLKFRIVRVSEETFRDFGLYGLPTIVFLRDGQPIAAREDAPRDEKDVPNLPPAPPAKAPATRRN
jgi:hypothetical protein